MASGFWILILIPPKDSYRLEQLPLGDWIGQGLSNMFNKHYSQPTQCYNWLIILLIIALIIAPIIALIIVPIIAPIIAPIHR